MKKIRVGVLFGGQLAEHEVSLQSAKNVIEAIDKEKYEVVPIGIDKAGQWHLADVNNYLIDATDPRRIALQTSSENTAVTFGDSSQSIGALDVVFPVLHGTNGEDGTMQGLLRLLDVAFVGPDVLGSAINMDKDVMKRLLWHEGLPVADWTVLVGGVEEHRDRFASLAEAYGLPFFVKPANAGSSVGVTKVKSEADFASALTEAFRYDRKVLVERAIVGREIEVAVLGNETPKASVLGELVVHAEFYSYEAKYIDADGATAVIPADLPTEVVQKIQELAIKAFQVTECEGMARVDFFVTKNNAIYLNELNTIPGFTKISMYPKLWEASGVSYSELIDQLLTLAIARHERDGKRRIDYSPR